MRGRPFLGHSAFDYVSNKANKYYVYALFALIQSDYIEKKDPQSGQLNQIISLSEN